MGVSIFLFSSSKKILKRKCLGSNGPPPSSLNKGLTGETCSSLSLKIILRCKILTVLASEITPWLELLADVDCIVSLRLLFLTPSQPKAKKTPSQAVFFSFLSHLSKTRKFTKNRLLQPKSKSILRHKLRNRLFHCH